MEFGIGGEELVVVLAATQADRSSDALESEISEIAEESGITAGRNLKQI